MKYIKFLFILLGFGIGVMLVFLVGVVVDEFVLLLWLLLKYLIVIGVI